MTATVTAPQPQPELSPEDLQLLQSYAAEADQQDRARAAASLPTRVAADVWGGIQEAPAQLARGVTAAVDSAASGLRSLVGAAGLVSQEFMDRNPADPVADSVSPEATTVTGGLVKGVSQFVAGLIPAGRVLKMAGSAVNLGRAAVGMEAATMGRVAGAAAQGAIADFVAFDPHEERLSNLVEEYPALSNPVTQYLAADPNDSEAEGRFKNAVEGLGIGAAMDGLLHGLKLLRGARRGDTEAITQAAADLEGKAPAPEDPVESLARDNARPAAEGEPKVQPTSPMEPRPEAAADGAAPKVQPTVPESGVDRSALGDNPTADPMGGKKPAPKLIDVDASGLRNVEAQVLRETGYGQGRSISGIRTDLIENGEDIAAVMNSLRVVYREKFADAIGGSSGDAFQPVRTFEEVRKTADKMADVLGDDPDLFWQRMSSIHGTTQNLDAELAVYRDMLATVHDKTLKLAEAVNDPTGANLGGYASRVELISQFQRHVELGANVTAAYKGLQTNVARALNSMRLPARIDPALLKHGADGFFDGGEEAVRRMASRILTTEGDLGAFTRATRGGWLRNAMSAVNEYWINSVLSGAKTHAANVLSNTLTTALQPAERMIAGAFRVASKEGRQEFAEGALQYAGLAASLKDAFRMAGKALRQGDTLIDPGHMTVEVRDAFTARSIGNASPASSIDPVSGLVTEGLGKLVRLPSRLLMAEDELFKQLNYRARIRAESLREGFLRYGADPERLGRHVAKALDGKFDALGRATDRRHLEAAREVTFTADLQAATWSGGRTFGETLQKASANHPMLTMILPFIRTPTNIVRFTWDRTPGLNLMRKQYYDDLTGKNGVEASGRAAAKAATGAAMWGTALVHAAQGDLTGGGPADPQARRALEQTGWRPYSVRVQQEDGSVAYRAFDRTDPFGMFFGIAADVAEVAGFVGEREYGQLATDMTVALARQLQNKTYLSGLTRALGALAEPEKRGERFLYGLAGSFVPSFLNQQMKDDPLMREVRSLADALRARTPGLSLDVDPVRNILGEPVYAAPGWGPEWLSPIATTTHGAGQQPNTPEWRMTPQDTLHDELARQLIIHGTSIRPPSPEFGSVDMRDFLSPRTGRTAYDRYQELTGTLRIGGQTLAERLSALIRSPLYRSQLTDGVVDADGSRVDAIRAILGAYRQAAMAEAHREMPDLAAAYRAEQRRRAVVKVGR